MNTTIKLVLALCCLGFDGFAEEELEGPPLVTAKAWAIAEAGTGKHLWGMNAGTPEKTASTTKMMCAYVVLKLAETKPAVLDEMVTFSKLADQTGGTTTEIHEGEQVTLRDGLYGLLLPSGNDMGNAFAEHFNGRLKPPGDETPKEVADPRYASRRNFIAEMNRAGLALGLEQTHYRLPYGDGGTMDDRTTTARELLIVAHAAMQIPLFRGIVGTSQHVAQIRTSDGGQREITWKNTNKLLALSDYDGVKTGSTPSAGSCLIASGHR